MPVLRSKQREQMQANGRIMLCRPVPELLKRHQIEIVTVATLVQETLQDLAKWAVMKALNRHLGRFNPVFVLCTHVGPIRFGFLLAGSRVNQTARRG